MALREKVVSTTNLLLDAVDRLQEGLHGNKCKEDNQDGSGNTAVKKRFLSCTPDNSKVHSDTSERTCLKLAGLGEKKIPVFAYGSSRTAS